MLSAGLQSTRGRLVILLGAVGSSSPAVPHSPPSPIDWDLRRSDAEAVVTLLHVRHFVDPRTPLLAELFQPEHAAHLPADRNLFAVSSLSAVAAANAQPRRPRRRGGAGETVLSQRDE